MTPILNQVKGIKREFLKNTIKLKNGMYPLLMKHSEDKFGYYS